MDYRKFIRIFLKFSFDPKTGSDLGYITMDEFFNKLAEAVGRPEKAQDWRQRFVRDSGGSNQRLNWHKN